MKISKQQAHYKKAKVSTVVRCEHCKYMNHDGSCDKVTGQVKPDHVCNLWASSKKMF